jgi:hypothetical protein
VTRSDERPARATDGMHAAPVREFRRMASSACRLLRCSSAVTRMTAITVVCALAAAATAPAMTVPPARPVAAQGATLQNYELAAVWPDKTAGTAGIVRTPAGLDIGVDDRVYISDPGVGGVHVMLPSGQFLPPFGTTGPEIERAGTPGRLAVDQALDRVYVVDTAVDRLVLYDLDGKYLGHWKGIPAAAIAIGPDSRVYVADREHNAIRVLDSAGKDLFAFGSAGTGDGEFISFTDVSVSPDGKIIAVGDMLELRVQLFNLSSTGAALRRTYMLNHPKYGLPSTGLPPWKQCRAGIVYALGDDDVWVGDGTGACVLSPASFTYAIASTFAGGTVCKQTVRLPRVRTATNQYVALATYDPNEGPCFSTRGQRRQVLPTSLAVVAFADAHLTQLKRMTLVTANSDTDAGLLSPFVLSVPVPGTVFVQDVTRYTRTFAPDGTALGRVPLTGRAGQGATVRYTIERAEGSDRPDEIFGYYRREHRGRTPGGSDGATRTPVPSATATNAPTATPTTPPTATKGIPEPPEVGNNWVEDQHGIGRFRATTVREFGRDVLVLDPIWTNPFSLMSPERAVGREGTTNVLQVIDVVYDQSPDEVLALVVERRPKERVDDARIDRFVAADGAGRAAWDLADDAVTAFALNPYVDLSAGPDGRVYALDDFTDVALALDAAGNRLGEIPVGPDVKQIAGGPDGVLFGLRESGYIERYAFDGTVTARFDGRPLATSDPTNMSAVAADERGWVYTADAFASLIGVFKPADPASAARPVPGDATCLLSGDKTADPVRLLLGETTTVGLTVDGRCGVGEPPTDIILTVLYYPEYQFRFDGANDDPAAPAIKSLRRLVSRIDLRRHRVGIVSYWRDTRIELAPTSDPAALLRAIQKINRRWPCWLNPRTGEFQCFGMPDVRQALRTAQTQLASPDGRRHVIVLFQPDYCSRDIVYSDGECREYTAAEDQARTIQSGGTQIVVFDGDRPPFRQNRFNGTAYLGDAQVLASSDADVVFDYPNAQKRMVAYGVPPSLATSFKLVDEVPSNMSLIAASVAPPATIAGQQVQWDVPALPYAPGRFALTVRPEEAGRWPTNMRAVADFIDGWGKPGQIVFPVPQVDVNAPTPTPEEPTPTPPPPTAVPPTATPVARGVYMPIALRTWALATAPPAAP